MLHSLEILAQLLANKDTWGIIIDVGLSVAWPLTRPEEKLRPLRRPLTHKNNNYNCRVIIYNGKILLIRPKMWMANDGNYVRDPMFDEKMRLTHDGFFAARAEALCPVGQAPSDRGALASQDYPECDWPGERPGHDHLLPRLIATSIRILFPSAMPSLQPKIRRSELSCARSSLRQLR